MSTRGIIGFRIDGADKITYNHSDSYPSWMGEHLVAFVSGRFAGDGGLDQLKADVRALRMVDGESAPTAADVERYSAVGARTLGDTNYGKKYGPGGCQINTGKFDNWYNLLYNTHGDLAAILAVGVMEDGHNFVRDSLFCEWGWIINLDDGVLEVYRGFQKRKHRKGRYAGPAQKRAYKGAETYYPIALVATFPLDALPDDIVDALDTVGVDAY